jgi:sulfur-carrier protein
VKIRVEAFATVAPFLPPAPRGEAAFLDLAEGSTVSDVARLLRIPSELSVVTLVNGDDATPDRPLRPGDVVTLYPPLVGG